MITMTAANAAIDTDAVWEEMERRGLVPAVPPRRRAVDSLAMPAASSCPRRRSGGLPALCRDLHRRRRDSLTRCAALGWRR